MKLRHWFAVSLFMFAAACAADKFPYPPEFVSAEQISMQTLAAPPAKGSDLYEAEVKSIVARQAKLTDAEKAQIKTEDHISPQMIVLPVLGAQYTEADYPAMYTLLRHAASDSWRISDATEDYWNSPRPWVAEPQRVKLYVSQITRPGYPSGHTTTNIVWAHVLSMLFPAQRDALFDRAMAIGGHRIDAGAHFPHDVRGGKELGDAIFAKMGSNPEFQRELMAAKAELNAHNIH